MNTEQQKIEYKSLQKIRTGEKGFKELSTTCVALANAQGGQIMIGVEDKTKKPGPNQIIPQEEANLSCVLSYCIFLLKSQLFRTETKYNKK